MSNLPHPLYACVCKTCVHHPAPARGSQQKHSLNSKNCSFLLLTVSGWARIDCSYCRVGWVELDWDLFKIACGVQINFRDFLLISSIDLNVVKSFMDYSVIRVIMKLFLCFTSQFVLTVTCLQFEQPILNNHWTMFKVLNSWESQQETKTPAIVRRVHSLTDAKVSICQSHGARGCIQPK